MKKIIVLFVLLALLSAAVFADDSGWKIGFTGQLSRDFFSSSKATGEWEYNSKPKNGSASSATGALGEFIKGSSHMWTWTSPNPWDHDTSRPDNRLIVSLSNSGDHYSAYIDAKLDNGWASMNQYGGPTFSFMNLISGDAADWSFSGDTGALGSDLVIDGKVGTGRYGGFVPAYEFWNDWIQSGDYNFFGVSKYGVGFIQSDNISTANVASRPTSPWDAVYAVGATFGGNFRFAIGSTLDQDFNRGTNNPYASSSDVRGAFMLSGKGLGPLAFDVFYAIDGGDKNTVARGTGEWENLFGVYVNLNVVENLGLSLGYTANFKKVETSEIQDWDVTKRSLVTYETEYPIWSGVDIKLTYSGIDKVGITFNNNISFASASGAERKKPGDTVVYGLDDKVLSLGDVGGEKYNTNDQSWLALNTVLGASYSLTDNLSVTFAVLNLLSIYTTDSESVVDATKTTTTTTIKKTNDELRGAISVSYNAGNVSFGLGFVLGLTIDASEGTQEISVTGGGGTYDYKDSLSILKVGVPIFFKVSI